ncbi:MAG: glycosyl transferase family 2, partial [Gemmatimonadota bacterium]
ADGTVESAATGAYVALLLLLFPFGLHRLYLLWLRFRRSAPEVPSGWHGYLPPVTVQVPVYNEANVVERAVDAACR